MFCGNCGKEYDSSSKFCPGCGEPNPTIIPINNMATNENVSTDYSQPAYDAQPSYYEAGLVQDDPKAIKKANGFVKFIGVILHLVLLVAVLTTIFGYTLSHAFSKGGDILKSLDMKLDFDDDFLDMLEDYGVDSKSYKKELTSITEDMISETFYAIFNGGEAISDETREKFYDFLEEYEDVIEESSGLDIDDVYDELDDLFDEMNEELDDMRDEMFEEAKEDPLYYSIFMLVQTKTTVMLCVFDLVMVLLLLLLFRKNLDKSLIYSGVASLNAALIAFGFSRLVTSVVENGEHDDLFDTISGGFPLACIIAAAVGVVFIIIGKIYRANHKYYK